MSRSLKRDIDQHHWHGHPYCLGTFPLGKSFYPIQLSSHSYCPWSVPLQTLGSMRIKPGKYAFVVLGFSWRFLMVTGDYNCHTHSFQIWSCSGDIDWILRGCPDWGYRTTSRFFRGHLSQHILCVWSLTLAPKTILTTWVSSSSLRSTSTVHSLPIYSYTEGGNKQLIKWTKSISNQGWLGRVSTGIQWDWNC